MTTKLIVDTHYLIWDLLGHDRLTKKVDKVLSSYQGRLCICSMSFWEIGMLVGKGRIHTSIPVGALCRTVQTMRSYEVLPLTPEIAELLAQMASIVNGDPADRVIAATTAYHKATLLTADQNLIGLELIHTIQGEK